MKLVKILPHRTNVIWTSLLLGLNLFGTASVTAQPLPTQTIASSQASHPAHAIEQAQIVFNAPPPPDTETPAGRQRGGASRRDGSCYDQYGSLTALVPMTNDAVWGLTASEHPTFWFYIPSRVTAESVIEFSLYDAQGNVIYYEPITSWENETGFVRVSVSSTSAPLSANQSYQWGLSISCDRQNYDDSIYVRGTIQRVTPDAMLHSQLATASPQERVRLYASHGLWYDALNTLAQLYRTQPSDRHLAAIWSSLLHQADLGTIASVPFTPQD